MSVGQGNEGEAEHVLDPPLHGEGGLHRDRVGLDEGRLHPGHEPVVQLAAARGLGLEQSASLFARLNSAMADALIACWEAKYHYDFWRPVTAVAAADRDGNTDTAPAVNWTSFIVTPPFPSYPSGHACAGAAARVVLEHEFGPDGFEVTLTSPAAPELSRSYHAWQDLLDDVNDARVFGGVHYRFDQEQGGELGRAVGEYDQAHAPEAARAPATVRE